MLVGGAAFVTGRAVWQGLQPTLNPPGCQVLQAEGGPFDLPAERFAHAATISSLAVKRRLPSRAAVIAVATAMQESKLRNLRHGDLDSLGLFQQRPSQGWGTPQQILDPVYAASAFYDHLVRVPRWQSRPLTDVAQAVQRSAYPLAYAKHETQAQALASAFTGEHPASATCRLGEPDTTWSRQRLRSHLLRETGLRASDTEHGVQVVTPNARLAWTAGSWAVAHAQDHGTVVVTVEGRAWTRALSADALSWQPAETPAPAGVVRIDLYR